MDQQRWNEAEALLHKCLTIDRKYFGKYHNATLYIVKALEKFYGKIGNKRKARYYSKWLQEANELSP